MAFSRAYLFDPKDQSTSNYNRAFGHPVRIDIVKHLYKHGSTPVMDFVKKYPLSYASISQHLSILRKAHLVLFAEQYPFTFYSLDRESFIRAKNQLLDFLGDFEL